MKSPTFRAFITGLTVVLVFVGCVVGLDTALHRLFPEQLDTMAALIFGPVEIILVLVAGMALSIGIGLWMLRPMPVRSRLFILLVGGAAIPVYFMALWFAFPTANRFLLVAGLAIIGGIIYSVETALLSARMALRVIISLVLVACGAWVASVQYSSGTQRAQLKGLTRVSYGIYIPADTSGRKTESIVSADETYDGYEDGVIVHLAGGRSLIERKVDHRPTENCGSPFIGATDDEKDFSCRLVTSNNGVDVYLLEGKSYASYYHDYDVHQVYFAVAGSTWISSGASLRLHDVMNPKAQTTPEQITAFSDTKALLLELVPVSDFSPYVRRR